MAVGSASPEIKPAPTWTGGPQYLCLAGEDYECVRGSRCGSGQSVLRAGLLSTQGGLIRSRLARVSLWNKEALRTRLGCGAWG
jgi:hypothetical protein